MGPAAQPTVGVPMATPEHITPTAPCSDAGPRSVERGVDQISMPERREAIACSRPSLGHSSLTFTESKNYRGGGPLYRTKPFVKVVCGLLPSRLIGSVMTGMRAPPARAS